MMILTNFEIDDTIPASYDTIGGIALRICLVAIEPGLMKSRRVENVQFDDEFHYDPATNLDLISRTKEER